MNDHDDCKLEYLNTIKASHTNIKVGRRFFNPWFIAMEQQRPSGMEADVNFPINSVGVKTQILWPLSMFKNGRVEFNQIK